MFSLSCDIASKGGKRLDLESTAGTQIFNVLGLGPIKMNTGTSY